MSPVAAEVTSFDFALCLVRRPALYGFACKLTRDHDAASDLVQDTLLKAYTHWAAFRPRPGAVLEQAVSTWLHEILRNTFLNDWRKTRVRQRLAAAAAEHLHGATLSGCREERLHGTTLNEHSVYVRDPYRFEAPRTDLATQYRSPENEQLSDELTDALADLDPKWRRIAELVWVHDGAYHEVARTLGIPIGTVMSALNRVRNRMIARLGPYAARAYGITDQRAARQAAEAAP